MSWRAWTGEAKTIVGGAVIVGILSLGSRVLGIVRDRVLSGAFGAGDTLDVYYAAFKVPDALFALLAVGVLSAVFIPGFCEAKEKGEAEARLFTQRMFTLVVFFMGVAAFGCLIASEQLATLIAPGFSPEKQMAVASALRIMLIAQIALAASAVFGGVLQGLRFFFLSSLAPLFYNLGIMAGAIFFAPHLGSEGLAWGVVLGACTHLLLQALCAASVGYGPGLRFPLGDRSVMRAMSRMLPRVLALGISQLQLFLLFIIASFLATGSVTLFQFAYNIQFLPVGLVGVSYAVAAFPSFAERAKNPSALGDLFSSSLRHVLFLMVPFSITLLLLRAQAVRLVVGTDAFDWEATIATADAVALFAVSGFPQAAIYLLSRAFFALHNTVIPLVAGLIALGVNIVFALWLTPYFGIAGLAGAFSLSALVQVALLWVLLRSKLGSLGEYATLRASAVATAAALGQVVVIQLAKPLIPSAFGLTRFWTVALQAGLCTIFGFCIYFGISWALKSPECKELTRVLHRRILRRAPVAEPVGGEGT